MPWLIQSLKDKKVGRPCICRADDQALVRSITCWTLGRYSSWAVQSHPEDKSLFFIPTMEGVSVLCTGLELEPF